MSDLLRRETSPTKAMQEDFSRCYDARFVQGRSQIEKSNDGVLEIAEATDRITCHLQIEPHSAAPWRLGLAGGNVGLTLLSDTPDAHTLFAICDGQGYYVDCRKDQSRILRTAIDDIQYYISFPELKSVILLGRFDVEFYSRNNQRSLRTAITADGFWDVKKGVSSLSAIGWRPPDHSFSIEIDGSTGEVQELR